MHLDEEGQMDEYRIQVHGMKSAAALVGIIPLSGCAKMLEDAAKRSDREMILQMTPIFLREWRGFRERLAQFADEPETDVEKKEDDSELMALLAMLQGAAESMDIDTMDEIIEQIPQYQMPEESLETLEKLKMAVMNLETDTIFEITNQWMDRIRN
jgi:chemotaxis protein histidine kinase CheA